MFDFEPLIPGEWVSTLAFNGLVTHIGMAISPYAVISNCMFEGEVIEQTLRGFAGRRPLTRLGLQGPRSPLQAITSARRQRGRPYQLLKYNCEHFVHEASGLPATSPQLSAWLKAGALLGIGALAIVNRKALTSALAR